MLCDLTLQQSLGYTFKNPKLLVNALTHRSFSADHNERLEFLGDSVLNCAIAYLLMRTYPDAKEGVLSHTRAHLVKKQTLYEVALRLAIAPCLRLGEGEKKSGGSQRPSILADTLEAVIAAVFLDSNFDTAVNIIENIFSANLKTLNISCFPKDAKTRLQEWLQGRKKGLPTYTVVPPKNTGDECYVTCVIHKMNLTVTAHALSRKEAEQKAAALALNKLSANVLS